MQLPSDCNPRTAGLLMSMFAGLALLIGLPRKGHEDSTVAIEVLPSVAMEATPALRATHASKGASAPPLDATDPGQAPPAEVVKQQRVKLQLVTGNREELVKLVLREFTPSHLHAAITSRWDLPEGGYRYGAPNFKLCFGVEWPDEELEQALNESIAAYGQQLKAIEKNIASELANALSNELQIQPLDGRVPRPGLYPLNSVLRCKEGCGDYWQEGARFRFRGTVRCNEREYLIRFQPNPASPLQSLLQESWNLLEQRRATISMMLGC